jgi:hypothetical protein
MMTQLIDVKTGEFSLDHGFTVSPAATLKDLQEHYGKQLKKSEFAKGCWYFPEQVKIGDLYFVFRFSFEHELLKSIGFEIEEEPKERNPWGNNRDFETRLPGRWATTAALTGIRARRENTIICLIPGEALGCITILRTAPLRVL